MSDKIKEWDSYFGTHCRLPAAAIRDLFDRIEELEAQKKAWKGTAEAYKRDLEHYEAENERLRAVYEAARMWWEFPSDEGPDTYDEAHANVGKALAAAQEKDDD